MTKLPIKRLFIANRGEVCRRIAITAKRLGLETATVLVEDESPVFLSGVIDKFARPDAQLPNPYLSIPEMIKLATESDSDAIHPGFGFLSENDDFAAACIKAGLTWVGPHPQSISAMASKAAARDLAVASKVPVNQALQGIELTDQARDLEAIKKFAKSCGYPVLVKAAFGGGGKGMRLVHEEAKLEEAVLRCHSEGKSSFANGQLLVEKYIGSPRHVEVQILGDKHGNVYAIGDRDCSAQRRHQKIIEEAPAPCLNKATRAAMHAAAVNLAQKVGYDSAGTVEFLVDASADYRDERQQGFFFLEMNTRLQVEHPVTEEIFGIDLVEWQLRVACGEALPDFSQLVPRSWSIEARIYAEDCEAQFLPSPGRVDTFIPHHDLGIRWEVGIDRCGEVSPRFDPMVAKCIATGPTRDAAIDRLRLALQKTVFFGPKNNMAFVRALVDHELFRAGGISTHFIQEQLDRLIGSMTSERDAYQTASAELLEVLKSASEPVQERADMIDNITAQVFANRPLRFTASAAKRFRTIDQVYFAHGTNPDVQLTYRRFTDASNPSADIQTCVVKEPESDTYWINFDGAVYSDRLLRSSLTGFDGQGTDDDDIKAPVPGKIVLIKTAAGSALDKNEVVLVLESMKMEFEIKSVRKGTIESVLVTIGQQVSAGQTLATWQA